MTGEADFIEMTGELIGCATGDQLTREERVRLEALAQAVASCAGIANTQGFLTRAAAFHSYITDGTVPE